MVSNRNRYVSESTSDDETGDMEYLPNNQAKPPRKPTRTPKCFSKNALMARENRLKKKMYITTLENQVAALKNENKKLSQMVDSQAEAIEDMKKEVKYLKSILANSEGIGKLLKAINSSTGMAVSSSITSEVKPQFRMGNSSPIAEKTVPQLKSVKDSQRNVKGGFDITRHPWEETGLVKPYESYPTPDSSESSILYGSPEFEELNSEGLLLDMDLPMEMSNDELLDMIDEKALESPIIPIEPSNYHNLQIKSETNLKDEDDDVGVCLHVAKNKVSLEFCPSCSDKALQSWKLK